MKEVQFTEYTTEAIGPEEHRILMKTADNETIVVPISPETQELVMKYINDMMTGKPTLIEEEPTVKDIVAQKLLDYSRSYLNRKSAGDEQETIHIVAAEEYLALSMMIERFHYWDVDPEPVLKQAAKRYKHPFDITRYNVIMHCLSLIEQEHSEKK